MLVMRRPFAVLMPQHCQKSGAGDGFAAPEANDLCATAGWQSQRRRARQRNALGHVNQARCMLVMHRPLAVLRHHYDAQKLT